MDNDARTFHDPGKIEHFIEQHIAVDMFLRPEGMAVSIGDAGQFILRLRMLVRHRSSRKIEKLNSYAQFPRPASPSMIVRAVRDALISHYAHEVDESVLVDGRRVFDPHDKENRIKGTMIMAGGKVAPPYSKWQRQVMSLQYNEKIGRYV